MSVLCRWCDIVSWFDCGVCLFVGALLSFGIVLSGLCGI